MSLILSRVFRTRHCSDDRFSYST